MFAAAIVRDWSAARDAVLGQLREKAAAPLDQMRLTPDARQAVQSYRARIAEVAALSASLLGANARLDIVKEQAQADDLAALTSDLAKLNAQKVRFYPAVAQCCYAYLAGKEAKGATELLRTQARTALDQ